MRIALGQINTTVGDLSGNAALMLRMSRRAAEAGADVVVFPELSLIGYPPQDLLDRPALIEQAREALEKLAVDAAPLRISIICGTVEPVDTHEGKRIWNTAAVLCRGRVHFRQRKMLLPNYDVFDEQRYFRSAEKQELLQLGSTPIALTICEDAWNDESFWEKRLYERDPVSELTAHGAQVLISINASPYHRDKRGLRRQIFANTARKHRIPVVYVNQVGGNDQLVFDGSSFAMDATGRVIAEAASFAEDLVIADIRTGQGDSHATLPEEPEAVYSALVLGTRDYLRKCGFSKVVLGLSGGIDSSLVACIAVEALGRENVTGIGMPGPYSTEHSVTDARIMAERLGIRFELISINAGYQAAVDALGPVFAGTQPGVAEENIQSRLRGLTLMAYSNKFNALVLTTGNKSEIAVGYCTLYGDMCGGLAVISDVPKTLVYELCRVANARLDNAIPESVFVKPPSAELRPDQKDSDSLPEYDVLDPILKYYVEDFLTPAVIADRLNLPLALVRDVTTKVDRNEYKRQQAAPGIKVTSKAFGIGRRYPIAQRYRE
ncbi:MAG TPA: NAD+ synthase [Bryobacteraceae bacterium]|nr:NAD+ synthase [Bryobacteraceae bacterium]